jgi:hypothetical protein
LLNGFTIFFTLFGCIETIILRMYEKLKWFILILCGWIHEFGLNKVKIGGLLKVGF